MRTFLVSKGEIRGSKDGGEFQTLISFPRNQLALAYLEGWATAKEVKIFIRVSRGKGFASWTFEPFRGWSKP